MLGYIGRRLLHLFPVLLAVTLLTFLIASLLPGDLAYAILGDQATPDKVAALRAQMGLDQPIAWRYLHWLGGVIQGDLGRSFRTGETVLAAIGARLPVSLQLMLMAEVAGLLIGVPLGIFCAVRQGGSFDRLLTGGAFGMLSVPAFLWAILLIYLFAVRLRVLPATGWVPFEEDAFGNLRSFVLPALTLALGEWPVLMRVLRSDMIATLQEDYIVMAKAKGLKPARILLVHALKPSSLTLVTVTGINIGRLIGGAIIVETIFALPGIGRLLVGAIYARDFVILQGVVLFVAVGFVLLNFAVDMLYAVLDLAMTIGFLSIPPFARVARAATLTLAEREFVTAARALGATHARILLRELLPNVLLPLLAFFLLAVAVTIVVEGALSFLGLGVPPPRPSWGSMIGEGRESLDIAPWLAFLPAGVLFATVLSFNLVGDALRAITDPRENAL